MKTKKIVLIVVAVIIAVPLLGRLIWSMQKSRHLDLMIINKTVPKTSENEVKSLNWVLNHGKYLKTNNLKYDFTLDYYGFHPKTKNEAGQIHYFKLNEIETLKEKYECLLFLDNKGVSEDFQETATSADFFGGFNQNDYLLLKDMVSNSKLVVIESDFFSTYTEDLVRYNTQQLLDVYSLGWKGRFFKDLSARIIEKEIGQEWIDNYKNFSNENWEFNGPGLVMINDKQDRIVVLPRNKYMNKKHPEVVTGSEFSKKMCLPERTAYTGWFDVFYPGENTVISSFDLNMNQEGINLLKRNGLSDIFPASIKSTDGLLYFLAGDFSKQQVVLASSKIRLVNDLYMSICKNMTGTPGKFFQTYYVPFMSCILDDYYNQKTKIQALLSE